MSVSLYNFQACVLFNIAVLWTQIAARKVGKLLKFDFRLVLFVHWESWKSSLVLSQLSPGIHNSTKPDHEPSLNWKHIVF